MVYSTRRFVVCLCVCYFVLVFFSPFSSAIISLGEERANLSAFRTLVWSVLVWICRFPLPLGSGKGCGLWLWHSLDFSLIFFLENKIFKCFFPYKCIGKQNWPCHKKVKCQCTTFILAILVDPCPRWFMQRFSPKASSVLEKKIFKGFLPYMGMAAILVNEPWPF